MRKRVAEDDVDVEVGESQRGAGTERDDDVGVVALRHDVRAGVVLAAVDLSKHLARRVAAPRAVALDLPGAVKLLLRGQEDPDLVRAPQGLGVEVEQPLGDQKAGRAQVDGGGENPAGVVVDRLHHRFRAAQVGQVLGEDVEVVGRRVEGGDPELGAPSPLVAVVVVAGDEADVFGAQDPHEPACERRLAGPGVADEAENDRTAHGGRR